LTSAAVPDDGKALALPDKTSCTALRRSARLAGGVDTTVVRSVLAGCGLAIAALWCGAGAGAAAGGTVEPKGIGVASLLCGAAGVLTAWTAGLALALGTARLVAGACRCTGM
ncbi:MAG TPA: hypothetical protein VGF62_06385, partial [Rhizomicrobium sp.]